MILNFIIMRLQISLSMVVSVAIVLAFSFLTCSAKNETVMNDGKQQIEVDSIMYQALGDSIGDLLSKSKCVKLIIHELENDSVKLQKSLRFRKTERSILQFILSNPWNYQSDNMVYGRFLPSFQILIKKGNEECTLNFDFGLRKWNVCDKMGKEIKRFDLNSNEMLRFAQMQFPEDKFINELLKIEKK